MARTWNSSCLSICAVLSAIISALYFVLQSPNAHASGSTILLLGELTLAAGACVIAAAIAASPTVERWPLWIHGIGLVTLGLIYCFLVRRYPVGILTIALVVMLLAIGGSVAEFFASARQRHSTHSWLLRAAGAASLFCALVFFSFGLRWIALSPGSGVDLLWLALYFAASAIGMVMLALRPRYASI